MRTYARQVSVLDASVYSYDERKSMRHHIRYP